MKRKVKKYASGETVTSRGGDTNMRRSSDEEFAEDNKFGGYGRYMPKPNKLTRGIKSTASEDRPTTSGVEDYESLGKRAPAKSTMSGPIEYISESIKEDTYKEPESSSAPFANFKSNESKFERNDNEVVEKKKPAAKKKAPAYKEKDPSRILESAAKSKSTYEDTGAKIGSQGDFKMKPAVPEKIEDKKRYGQGLTPYEKGKSISDMSKMLSGGKKETNKSIDDDEKLFSTRRRAAGMSQKINEGVYGMKKGGATKKMASGGKVSSASSRGDGIAQRGKTKGRIC